MSEKKTIQINPELFSLSNTTRKKRQPSQTNGNIKVKSTTPTSRNDTLKKRSILRMIREHQEEKYKKMFDENTTKKDVINTSSSQFESDFERSKEFLNKMIEDNAKNETSVNRTLKNYPTQTNSLLYSPDIENININFPSNDTPTHIQPRPRPSLQPTPNYGCLKNGSLPTYRNWMNQTVKNNGIALPVISQQPHITVQNAGTSSTMSPKNYPVQHGSSSNHISSVPSTLTQANSSTEDSNINRSKQIDAMRQLMARAQTMKSKQNEKKMKQKKTIRRTYKIGKSKLAPKIAVLVSNKTIRNNISTKTQLLKQDPIHEIKKYLIKRGLIKVGSTAPNDVLRKMYESAILICGEVENHNPDILVYNYMNEHKSP
jgi:hypothetical protein